ncbi:MAG: PepSY domain-containing protein [Candidatus Rokubacteria bacterium]|nr:PepSY domain-containing protein [Candidatus Rokubacteria bacterium]
MKRFLSVALPVTAVILLAGVAFAQMGGPMAGGMGRGMGPGMMGGGMMGQGGQAGQWNCPGMAAGGQQTPAAQITEEKAKELAQQYANQYLKGFTVEKVLPFTAMHGTMYSVELKGPNDEVRTFHINPWGNVMPFGGPQRFGRVR